MGALPNTDKLDIHIDAEGFLEQIGLFPSYFVFTYIHLVCEGDLLVIAGWEESNFVDPVVGVHGKTATCIVVIVDLTYIPASARAI